MSSVPSDYNRASELNALAWTWFTVSSIAVGLRFYSRIRLTRNVWWDDWFILLTLIQTLVFTSLWTYLGALGGCRHLYYLEMNPEQAVKAIRINWITQPFAIMSLATGKVSVAFLIMRIMGKSKWRKRFLIWAAMVGSVVFCALAIILTFSQCKPVEALWNPALLLNGQAHCWPPYRQTDFSLFVGSWLAFIDLALALLPVSIIWNLQLSWQKKVGISALMGLGVFAFVCAVIKTAKLTELSARADITYITVSLWIWNANETNIVIVAACIPTLRPIFLMLIGRPESQSYKMKSYGERSHGGKTRLSRISAPIGVNESATAVAAEDGDEGWMELGTNQRKSIIRQTIELDVTSYRRSKDLDMESMPDQPTLGYAV